MFEKAGSGGAFFKAAEHMNDLAILLEPKQILKDQPHTYEGIQSVRDVCIADISIFANSEDIAKQEPSEVLKDCQITNTVLVIDVERKSWLGKAALVVIRKANRSYVYREPEFDGAEAAVEAYYTKREAAAKANLDDFPL